MKIEHVIAARLKLQSTQRQLLENFDMHFETLNSIKHLTSFPKWEPKKQELFIRTVGGPANTNKTREFLSKTYANAR